MTIGLDNTEILGGHNKSSFGGGVKTEARLAGGSKRELTGGEKEGLHMVSYLWGISHGQDNMAVSGILFYFILFHFISFHLFIFI